MKLLMNNMKKKINISEVKPNAVNPRYIKDHKFKKLVKSIKNFPEMLEKRPIIVDENMIVLGGNMRLKASIEAGLKEVWIDIAEGWSEDQKKEFIIKDNVGFGEWDWDILANEWNKFEIQDWGLNLPIFQDNLSNNDEYKGMNPDLELESFMNAEIKRLYLVYDSDTYSKVIDWFNKKLKETNLNDYSEYILKLIEDEKN
tara:strand:+ start:1689 stop:2288 length:600 start_codon:yes stop_codon:yes gene_type:complete